MVTNLRMPYGIEKETRMESEGLLSCLESGELDS